MIFFMDDIASLYDKRIQELLQRASGTKEEHETMTDIPIPPEIAAIRERIRQALIGLHAAIDAAYEIKYVTQVIALSHVPGVPDRKPGVLLAWQQIEPDPAGPIHSIAITSEAKYDQVPLTFGLVERDEGEDDPLPEPKIQ